RDGPVVRLVINRPHRRNSLTADDVGLLRDALETAAADPRTRAVVVEGTCGTLCSGMDLAELSADQQTKGGSDVFDLLRRTTAVPATGLASVAGQVLGGGDGLAAAYDLVVAIDRGALALPEAVRGLRPCALLPSLMRRVGVPRAYAMTLSTAGVTPSDARSFGLVD